MSSLKLGDWDAPYTPPVYPEVGDTFSRDILGTTCQTVIMPDGKEWMAQNLAWAGAGQWWNNAVSDNGNGRYYTSSEAWGALATALVASGTGWRLPAEVDDVTALVAVVGSPSALRLKSVGPSYWATANGTDDYGFGARGSGWYNGSGYVDLTLGFYAWLAQSGSYYTIFGFGDAATGAGLGGVGTSDRYNVRLVRDPVPIPAVPGSQGTHDLLVLPNGRAETTESLAQRVDVRLRTFIGEHWLNPELGVPWFEEFLRKAPDLAACRQILIAVIQDVPGIETIDSLEVAFSKSTRQMRVSFAVSGSDSIPQSGLTAVPL